MRTHHRPAPLTTPLEAFGDDGLVVVTDPAALAAASQIARRQLAAVADACYRALPRAEVHRLPCAAGEPVTVSPLLARLVRTALQTAAGTGGLVDPTIATPRTTPTGGGRPPERAWLPVCGTAVPASRTRGWRTVRLDGARITVPGGTTLDLRATAPAVALDDIALVASQLTGDDVVVRLGRRAARVGQGHATCDPRHVVEPRSGRPAPLTWQAVHVSASTCRVASAQAVAAAVLGEDAVEWLRARGADARLVRPGGEVVDVGRYAPVRAHAVRAA